MHEPPVSLVIRMRHQREIAWSVQVIASARAQFKRRMEVHEVATAEFFCKRRHKRGYTSALPAMLIYHRTKHSTLRTILRGAMTSRTFSRKIPSDLVAALTMMMTTTSLPRLLWQPML